MKTKQVIKRLHQLIHDRKFHANLAMLLEEEGYWLGLDLPWYSKKGGIYEFLRSWLEIDDITEFHIDIFQPPEQIVCQMLQVRDSWGEFIGSVMVFVATCKDKRIRDAIIPQLKKTVAAAAEGGVDH